METILNNYLIATRNNNHTEAALIIVSVFGTKEEVEIISAIQKRTKKRGFIQLHDQKERDAIITKYRKIIYLLKREEKMRSVLYKLIDSLPELDSEDEPLEGSEAVNILSQLWEEIKESVKP